MHVIGLDVLLPYGAADVVPIGDQRAVVLPCAAQLVGQQPFVECDRHAFNGLVTQHERTATFFGHALERRQEPGFELAVGEVRFGGGQVGVLVGQRFDCGFRCGRGHGCVRLSGFRAVTR